MIIAKTSVIALATMMGILPEKIPKSSQSSVPVEKSRYINSEILLVSLVRIVLTACGMKELVVSPAAIKPSIVTKVILCG